MAENIRLDPRDGTRVPSQVQQDNATEQVKQLRVALKRIKWQTAELGEAQALFEDLCIATREGAPIVRRRMAEKEEGKCDGRGCGRKFEPGRHVYATIVMNDPKTHIDRAYRACSHGCYLDIVQQEREYRANKMVGGQ